MSTPQSGPPDPTGQPTDTGEFRSQQGITLGWVSAIEQVMDQFRLYYAPEYEAGGKRLTTTWKRGGIPGAPVLDQTPAAEQPNYFIGEQYLEINYAPQTLVFA